VPNGGLEGVYQVLLGGFDQVHDSADALRHAAGHRGLIHIGAICKKLLGNVGIARLSNGPGNARVNTFKRALGSRSCMAADAIPATAALSMPPLRLTAKGTSERSRILTESTTSRRTFATASSMEDGAPAASLFWFGKEWSQYVTTLSWPWRS
jgi:hypothetical protein